MQLTPNLLFSPTFFRKTKFLCKYKPKEKKFNFFRQKCPSCTKKSFWPDLTLILDPSSTLPERTITLSERTSAGPPKDNYRTETEYCRITIYIEKEGERKRRKERECT
ncbi:hypothetical protein AMTRI_Chr08g163640 [Amborella trichopoda]